MTALKLYLLGPPQAELEDRPIDIPRRKLWALLAYLAINGGPQRRDSLATLLWPDSSQSQARAALSRHLSELRKTVGKDQLTSDRETVGLADAGSFWLDITQFQMLSTECSADDIELS